MLINWLSLMIYKFYSINETYCSDTSNTDLCMLHHTTLITCSGTAERFPSIPAYIRSVINTCRQRGFLTTIFRRRRFFPNITSHDTIVQSQAERQAVNFIIQGTCVSCEWITIVEYVIYCCYFLNKSLYWEEQES